MLIDAELYQFIIIGEAILFIENDKLIKYPYPWHLVRGFRNYIAPEYFGISMKIVWETIVSDLSKTENCSKISASKRVLMHLPGPLTFYPFL